MAGILTVDTIQSDSSYASTLNVASKMNFAAGMQIGGQDTTFGGMRNRVINGAMNIAQRNTSVSGITSTYDSYPAIDRFLHYQETTSAVCTVAQVADAPAGFVNSLKITVTTADASVAAGDRINIAHKIEGLNLLDFDFGLSTAKSFTVSFWVKSSVTGTYALEIYNYGISTASTATKTYTINSANTWEYKTVTFTGDTVYPHVKTNGASLAVWMWLMAGSNYNSTNGGGVFTAVGSGTQRAYGQTANIAATVNNTFQMTGMQLETGSAASPFEYRHFQQELALCKRYYEKSFPLTTVPANAVYSVWAPAISNYSDNLNIQLYIPYSVEKRTTSPTLTLYGGSSGKWQSQKTDGTWGTILGSTYSINNTSTGFSLNNSDWNGSSSWQAVTAGTGRMVRGDWTSDAEL